MVSKNEDTLSAPIKKVLERLVSQAAENKLPATEEFYEDLKKMKIKPSAKLLKAVHKQFPEIEIRAPKDGSNDRIVAILLAMINGNKINLRDISSDYKVSDRTIQRDMSVIKKSLKEQNISKRI